MGTLDSCPGSHEHRCPMLIYVCYVQHVFFIFKHWFCCKWQYNKYMFHFIDHLQFYFCEWLCRHVPQCTSLHGAYNTAKTILYILVIQLCVEKCKMRWKRCLFDLSKKGEGHQEAPNPQRVCCPHVPVDTFETNAIISIDPMLMSGEYWSVISRHLNPALSAVIYLDCSLVHTTTDWR